MSMKATPRRPDDYRVERSCSANLFHSHQSQRRCDFFRRLPTHTHTKREIRKTPLILGGHRWLFFSFSYPSLSRHHAVRTIFHPLLSVPLTGFCSVVFLLSRSGSKNRLPHQNGKTFGKVYMYMNQLFFPTPERFEENGKKKRFERYSISSSVWWCGKRFLGRVAPLPSRTRASIYMLMRCDYPCGMV